MIRFDAFIRFGRGLVKAPFARFAVVIALLVIPVSAAHAQQFFQSPEDAGKALIAAVKSNDIRAIMRVLGPDGAEIASSGDQVADGNARKQFVQAYEAKHQIAMDGDDKATLMVGEQEWPFPIPLIRRNESWRFDAEAGKAEILQRRIGRNELSAIQACRAYVDAQEEYAEKDRGAGIGVYAQRIVSRPGRKDGLYWPAQSGDESPIGELVARANSEGYRVGQQGRAPFHGYYYKVLTRQGPDARGGAMDYIVRGNMIGGFALVAYPAEYDNSGVMTFIVNQDGTVYEKDLGPYTAGIASSMTAFNPDLTWRKVVNDGVPQAKHKQGEAQAKPSAGEAQAKPGQ